MKKITLLLIVLMLLLSSCTEQAATPTVSPTAEATANPTAESTVDPTLEPTPEPTPETTMPPWTQDYEYEYKPYIISDTTRQVFGSKAVDLACDIIDAYIAYETSVPAADEDTAIAALSIAVRNFPPFDAFTRFNEYTAYKDGRVSWKNKQTKEEHDKMLVEFQKCIESYMKVLRKGDCETARAMALYKELLTGSWYNSSFDGKEVDETPIELTTYYFLLNRNGICIGYATSYIYLLLQAGIDAIIVSGMPQSVLDGQPGTPHDWVMMKIDGEYYFTDPTWEKNENELAYFCFPLEFREGIGGGEYPADHMRVGGLNSLDGFDLTSEKFREFRTMFGASIASQWKFKEDRSGIMYQTPNEAWVEFKF